MNANEVIIRLYDVALKKDYELLLDQRLSFTGNFKMLVTIGVDLMEYRVFSKEHGAFLKMDVAIENFEVYDHLYLYLFRM